MRSKSMRFWFIRIFNISLCHVDVYSFIYLSDLFNCYLFAINLSIYCLYLAAFPLLILSLSFKIRYHEQGNEKEKKKLYNVMKIFFTRIFSVRIYFFLYFFPTNPNIYRFILQCTDAFLNKCHTLK